MAVTHAGDVPNGVVQTASGFQQQFTDITTVGLGGGVTYNVLRLPVISVGLDARGATCTGVGSLDDSLFGVKLAANVPVAHVKPYVEAGAGLMTTRAHNISSPSSGYTTTAGAFTTHYDYYEVLGGMDYPWKKCESGCCAALLSSLELAGAMTHIRHSYKASLLYKFSLIFVHGGQSHQARLRRNGCNV